MVVQVAVTITEYQIKPEGLLEVSSETLGLQSYHIQSLVSQKMCIVMMVQCVLPSVYNCVTRLRLQDT